MRASAALAAALLLASAGAAGADAPFAPPAVVAIPPGPLGEAIRYGEKVATQTSSYVKAKAGAGLDCTSCHIKGARARPTPRPGSDSGASTPSTMSGAAG